MVAERCSRRLRKYPSEKRYTGTYYSMLRLALFPGLARSSLAVRNSCRANYFVLQVTNAQRPGNEAMLRYCMLVSREKNSASFLVSAAKFPIPRECNTSPFHQGL